MSNYIGTVNMCFHFSVLLKIRVQIHNSSALGCEHVLSFGQQRFIWIYLSFFSVCDKMVYKCTKYQTYKHEMHDFKTWWGLWGILHIGRPHRVESPQRHLKSDPYSEIEKILYMLYSKWSEISYQNVAAAGNIGAEMRPSTRAAPSATWRRTQ